MSVRHLKQRALSKVAVGVIEHWVQCTLNNSINILQATAATHDAWQSMFGINRAQPKEFAGEFESAAEAEAAINKEKL